MRTARRPEIPASADWRWRWTIVAGVTLLHFGVLGWATYGQPRTPPRKSEITIELGSSQPRAGGGATAVPPPSAPPALPPPVPQPAVRKPQPPRLATDGSEGPVPSPVPRPAPAPAPAAASPSPTPALNQADPAAAVSPSPAPAQAAPAAPTAAPAAPSGPASSGADQPVAYLNNPKPPYPRMAILQGIEGTVRLQVLVQADGTASQVLLAQSSGSDLLDKSALDTVARWRFTPARSQGADKAQWVGVPITFSLNRR